MVVRDLVGSLVETSLVEKQTLSRWEQFKKPGEKAKVMALSRCLPRPLVAAMLRRLSSDTLPFSDHLPAPFAFGGESVVFDISAMTAKPSVLKLYFVTENLEEALRKCRENQVKLQGYFGRLVVPSQAFVYESRFARGHAKLGCIQPKIEGGCLFTEDVASPLTADLALLRDGAKRMQQDTGQLPDFAGNRNVLVTSAGQLRIVDGNLSNSSSQTCGPGTQGLSSERFAQIETLYAANESALRRAG